MTLGRTLGKERSSDPVQSIPALGRPWRPSLDTGDGRWKRDRMAEAKRSWWIDKKHILHCYASSKNDCFSSALLDLPEIAGFYDPDLGYATQQINRILSALANRARPGLKLSVIAVGGGPLLAWTQPSKAGPDEGTIGPDDDPATIRQALRVKPGGGGKKRTYVIDPKTKIAICFESSAADCVRSLFWNSVDTAAEADLQDATRKVNAVLDGLRHTKGRGELSFVVVDSALLLLWTQPGIGSDAEPDVIRHVLGLTA